MENVAPLPVAGEHPAALVGGIHASGTPPPIVEAAVTALSLYGTAGSGLVVVIPIGMTPTPTFREFG
jgi:hypothetical protein